MIKLVVISGKGGTGKTTFTGALSHLIAKENNICHPIMVDADVDASNLELLLQPSLVNKFDFVGGEKAIIDPNECTNCGKCMEMCRFDAISQENSSYMVDPYACEGCGACELVCPTGAAKLHEQVVGEWYHSDCQFGTLIHAALFPGQSNSGKLIARIRNYADELAKQNHSNFILIDGPPGIGCPVMSAITGTTLAIIITEPSVSGIHDMQRALETATFFNVKPLVCINKYDLNLEYTKKIEAYCSRNEIMVAGRIPFDLTVVSAMAAGKTIIDFLPESAPSQSIIQIWDTIKQNSN